MPKAPCGVRLQAKEKPTKKKAAPTLDGKPQKKPKINAGQASAPKASGAEADTAAAAPLPPGVQPAAEPHQRRVEDKTRGEGGGAAAVASRPMAGRVKRPPQLLPQQQQPAKMRCKLQMGHQRAAAHASNPGAVPRSPNLALLADVALDSSTPGCAPRTATKYSSGLPPTAPRTRKLSLATPATPLYDRMEGIEGECAGTLHEAMLYAMHWPPISQLAALH